VGEVKRPPSPQLVSEALVHGGGSLVNRSRVQMEGLCMSMDLGTRAVRPIHLGLKQLRRNCPAHHCGR